MTANLAPNWGSAKDLGQWIHSKALDLGRSPNNISLQTVRPWIREFAQHRGHQRSWSIGKLDSAPWPMTTTLGGFTGNAKWDEPRSLEAATAISNGMSLPVAERKPDGSCFLKFYSAPGQTIPQDPDWVLTPCLIADRTGARIGRGWGCYDQWAHQHPTSKLVGVLHSDYILDEIPKHWKADHDHPLSGLMSEKGWEIYPGQRNPNESNNLNKKESF